MFDRISRSWALAGACWDVLLEDPALLIFPLLSALAIVLLMASFAMPVWLMYHSLQSAPADGSTTHTLRLSSYAATYLFYVITYSVVMFFNSALIAVALRRLDGESAGVKDGLQAALSNLPAILGYALIAATVGTILRAIEQRVGLIGRIVTSLIGAAWTLATAMTLPVLIVENVGPVEAISRSLDLLRRNWGENLIGNVGISVGIAVIGIPVCALGVLFLISAISSRAPGMIMLAATVLFVMIIGLSIVSSTLHSIYTAALYRYATGNKNNGAIGPELLADAFRSK
jgi:Family of unknown function (DUF6159)/Membrane domain of glycerophosphoryl diester phosphodiesterase